MLIPGGLIARDPDTATPPSCKPFTLRSNVCVGDMIAIIACSIAGVGFFFWAIHAVRKMREFPFTYNPEDEEREEEERQKNEADPFRLRPAFDDSSLAQNGAARAPTYPERVRARMLLTHPEEEFYREHVSAFVPPISSEYAQGPVAMPQVPPRAAQVGQSQRTSSRRSSRRGSLLRGGPHGYEYGMNVDYMTDVSSSHARGSPSDMPGDHRYSQSVRRMDVDPTRKKYGY